MGILEILFVGVALAMDACAIAMTNGMTDVKMPWRKTLTIGGFFGFFQFLMPLIGFFVTGVVASAFMATFETISAWISFVLLVVLGGKMLFESVKEMKEKRCVCSKNQTENGNAIASEDCVCVCDGLSLGRLTVQAIATSIDALAVGVTLQMAAISAEGLALGVWGATLLIGGVTFGLSVAAVYIGKAVGNKLADKAELIGGLVLIAIGLKLLIEGLA